MGEVKKEIQLEIGHVLFIDLVGYSKVEAAWNDSDLRNFEAILKLSGRRICVSIQSRIEFAMIHAFKDSAKTNAP